MPTFTVFTPTYNRAETLERAYLSLVGQSKRDLEWLIVDDGSTDGTERLLARLSADAPFPVTIRRQENAGKHVAINRAVALAAGELFLILDSDDWLLPHALERLDQEWTSMTAAQRAIFAGVAGRSVTASGERTGNPLPAPVVDSDEIELRWRYGVTGDNAGFIRTDLMREYPFPEADRFVTEGLVWNRIARHHPTRYLEEAIQGKEYRPEGLTRGLTGVRAGSAESTRLYYAELLECRDRMTARSVWRLSANHTRFAVHARRGIRGTRVPGTTGWWLTSLPAGVGLAVVDRVATARRG